MYLKHQGKYYKEIDLKSLSKEELLDLLENTNEAKEKKSSPIVGNSPFVDKGIQDNNYYKPPYITWCGTPTVTFSDNPIASCGSASGCDTGITKSSNADALFMLCGTVPHR